MIFKFKCSKCGNVFRALIGTRCKKCGNIDVRIILKKLFYKK